MPDDLYRMLSGENLEKQAEKAIIICTMDSEGFPHPAMLSFFEVIARDRRNIRLAPYASSGSADNMRRGGKAAMIIVDERAVYYIKGTVKETKNQMTCRPRLAMMNLSIEHVLADEPDEQTEASAYISSGITYKSPLIETELTRSRELLRELLEQVS